MQNRSIFILILFLSLLATVLVVWKIFFAPKPTVSPSMPIPTPVLILTPTLSPVVGRGDQNFDIEIQKKIQEKFPLLQFLPYQTTTWKIDYIGPLSLEVILQKDTLEIREEVSSWIRSKNVDPTTHQINWKVNP